MDGDVLIRRSPGSDIFRFMHWSYVHLGVDWQHTRCWQPPTEPDRITALERRVAELEERFAGLRTATATALELLRPQP